MSYKVKGRPGPRAGGRIIATSVWESETAFQSAGAVIGAAIRDVPFSDWEEKPRELSRAIELEQDA